MFSRFTRKRTPTKSKTSTQKSPMRVVHVEEPVPTLPEALNKTHETIANLKEEKVKYENKLSAHEVILNRAQAEFDNANDRNREQKRTTLNIAVKTKKMLTNNLNHINVQISKFETSVKTMDSMVQHSINVDALNSRAGKRKLHNKTKGGMFSMFRKNSTGTKKRGIFSMFSRTKTPSTRMSSKTLTPDEEADVDVAREIAKLEEEEKQQQELERLQQYLKNQQQEQEQQQKDLKVLQKDAERQQQQMIAAMNSRAPDFGTDDQLLRELENLKLENLAGTRKKRKLKKHKKKTLNIKH
jgi:chromosome segregation ATPase